MQGSYSRALCTVAITLVLVSTLLVGCSDPITTSDSAPEIASPRASSQSLPAGPVQSVVQPSEPIPGLAPGAAPQQTSPPTTAIQPSPATGSLSSSDSVPSAASAPNSLVEALVIRVVDGDTIEVSLNGRTNKVRYIGIDTPETVDPNRPVMPFGPEASAKNKELVDGKVVRLEKDVSETDRYGRLLRYVYIGETMVNAELIKLGYAQVTTYPPDVKYVGLFLQLQREARDAGRGLWGSSSSVTQPQQSAQTPSVLNPPPAATVTPSIPTLTIVSVTSPVNAGANAMLVAQTSPGAQCSITVYYKSGPSSASGLDAKLADDNGRVTWTWKVGSNTTPGSWRIVVKAASAGQSVTQEVYFDVQR